MWQEIGKEVKTSGRETQLQSQRHLTHLPAHQLGDALNIFVPLTAELSAWHMVGILQASAELRGGWAGSQAVSLEAPTLTTRG